MAEMKVGCIAVIEYPEASDRFILVEETQSHKAGRLNLPGGGINIVNGRWEYPKECVGREVPEESGLEAELTNFLGLFEIAREGKLHIAFVAKAIGGRPQATKKHPKVKSYPYERIERLDAKGRLRSDRVIGCIRQFRAGDIYPLSMVRVSERDELPAARPRIRLMESVAA